MQQLRPKETVPVVRHLDDPVDTNTYYIQAIIRDSLNGSIIETINLQKQTGSQRYTGRFSAPSEGSSGRKYIDVTTKVYSDSGYTTQDSQYGDENVQYIVAVDWSLGGPVQNSVFSGGPDIDYKKINRMIQENFDGVAKLIPTKEIKSLQKKVTGIEKVFETIIAPELAKAGMNIEEMFDKTDSFELFDAMQKKLDMAIKKMDSINFQPVIDSIGGIKTYINKLPSQLPKPQEIDINIIVDAINDLADIIGDMKTEVDKTLSKGVADIEKKVVSRDISNIKKKMQSRMQKIFKNMNDEDFVNENENKNKDKNEEIINKLLS